MTRKISFQDDYSHLAHPKILRALEHASSEIHDTYGTDAYSQKVNALFKEKLDKECAVHLISGGTLTNLITISHMLKPYESVIACDSGHISTHETGAIEATGHKVNAVQNHDGKLTRRDIENVMAEHYTEHMVIPRMVYLSQSTEKGTLYSKKELKDISKCCKENNLYLYLDGARIASALAAKENNVQLIDIANLCDVFYFGGTKTGLLFGEALIIMNQEITQNYRFTMKQKGGLLAKGAALGVQFCALLKDDLYLELAAHAHQMSANLVQSIKSNGYSLDVHWQTNQVFATLPLDLVETLEQNFIFLRWSQTEQSVTIRLVTSWETQQSNVDAFDIAIKNA